MLKHTQYILNGKIGTIGKEHKVPGTQAKPAAMGEKVLNIEILGNIIIIHFEFRKMQDNFIIPLQFSFFRENSKGCRSKCLGIGSYCKIGSFGNRGVCFYRLY